ncbi:MAG TPA: hypothetical protein VF338_02630 [Leptolinea sp.]
MSTDLPTLGMDAITYLPQQSFDAIAIIQQLTVMHGFHLLEVDRRAMPGVTCFILSGNTDETQVLRSGHPESIRWADRKQRAISFPPLPSERCKPSILKFQYFQ